MDTRIDPQLAMLAETAERPDELAELAETGFFGIESLSGGAASTGDAGAGDESTGDEVLVIVQSSGEAEELREAGMTIRSEIGDVFTGTIALDRLGGLVEADGVELVESSREMHEELDLAILDTRVNEVHQGPPGRRGSGVLVGVVDTGIDLTHPVFRRADGTSRIAFIWDQTLNRQGSEIQPAGFGYGVQYANHQINTANQNANPFTVVRHRDDSGHGTHVAGIAAGDGSVAGNNRPAFTFIGVAPEAEIIVVKVGGGGAEGLGTSANALDAVNYCFQRAQALGRPIVVNMSLGDNLGPHDGTSLLERGLDNLLGGQGRAFVKSAGNVGSARHHAGGSVTTGSTADVGFLQPAGNTTPDQLDVWYRGGDTFRAAVVDAAGNATGWVNVGQATTFTLAGGNTVRIDHRDNDPFNNDRRIFVTIQRGTASQTLPGTWSLRLRSVNSPTGGRFDGWIQRHNTFNQRPTFTAPFESNDRTISTPGTARHVITVASYVTRGAGVGSLSAFSSRGPTRDGRAAPTIAAPGESITSARAEPGSGNPYAGMGGTSMSAPHVAGVIALMLQRDPARTQQQLRTCLTDNARSDAFTGPVPNTAWGAGKLDAPPAVQCAGPRPQVSVIVTRCKSITTPCLPVSVIVGNCPSVTTPCGTVSVIQSSCPSIVGGRCPTVLSPCPSVPMTACPSVAVTTCPSNLGGTCPSVPQIACPGGNVQSVVVACPSLVGCPPLDPIVNPVVNPAVGPVVNPIVNPIAQPGLRFRRVGDGEQEGDDRAMDLDAPPLPNEGYYEYDEGWFDDGPN